MKRQIACSPSLPPTHPPTHPLPQRTQRPCFCHYANLSETRRCFQVVKVRTRSMLLSTAVAVSACAGVSPGASAVLPSFRSGGGFPIAAISVPSGTIAEVNETAAGPARDHAATAKLLLPAMQQLCVLSRASCCFIFSPLSPGARTDLALCWIFVEWL